MRLSFMMLTGLGLVIAGSFAREAFAQNPPPGYTCGWFIAPDTCHQFVSAIPTVPDSAPYPHIYPPSAGSDPAFVRCDQIPIGAAGMGCLLRCVRCVKDAAPRVAGTRAPEPHGWRKWVITIPAMLIVGWTLKEVARGYSY